MAAKAQELWCLALAHTSCQLYHVATSNLDVIRELATGYSHANMEVNTLNSYQTLLITTSQLHKNCYKLIITMLGADLATIIVYMITDFSDTILKDTTSGRIGDHHCC